MATSHFENLRYLGKSLFLILFISLICVGSAWAWPPLFGPEFTFTNAELAAAPGSDVNKAQTEANLAMLEKWHQAMEELRKTRNDFSIVLTKDKHGPSWRIQYQDGFWYQVGLDTGVLEVQTEPRTLEEFKILRDRIQQDVFGIAEKLGLKPHERLGQGHLNIGLESAFGSDAFLYRNYLVDQANHPELHLGIIGRHLGNAPTISDLTEQQQQNFKKIISDFDKHPTSIYALSRRIENEVYTSNPYNWTPAYYQNHRLDQVKPEIPIDQQRVEVRGVRPQVSVDEFILESELYEKRIAWLRSLSYAAKINVPPSAKMSPGELKYRFRNFLQESKMDVSHFEQLLPPEIANADLSEVKTAFDESHDDFGRVRNHYASAVGISQNLDPDQVEDFRKKALSNSNNERNLHHNPRIFTSEEADYLKKSVEQRAKAIKAFFEDLRSNDPRALRSGLVSREILESIMKNSNTSLDKIRNMNWDKIGMYYGPDIVRDSNGEFYILEDNTGSLGGMGDAVEARNDLLKLIPKYQEVLRDGGGENFAAVMAQTLRGLAGNSNTALVLATPGSQVPYNTRFIEQLAERGVYTVTKDGLKTKGPDYDRILLKTDGDETVLQFLNGESLVRTMPVGAMAIRNYAQFGFQNDFPETYRAFADGKIPMLGYPFFGFGIMADKELSSYIEKLIPFYLHEKPLIKYVPTLSFRDVDWDGNTVLKKSVFTDVFDHIDQYVIKKTRSSQGKDVHLGWKLAPAELYELKNDIVKNPELYIAQKRISLSQVGDQIVDVRVFSTITANHVYVSDYFWGRSQSVYGDGKVNVSLNGQVIPIFVEGRDTVPPSTIGVPAELTQAKINLQPQAHSPEVIAPAANADIRLTISVDWEGLNLTEQNLQAIREFRRSRPHVRLVHFLNAAYFTKPGTNVESVRQQIASVIFPGDELGLHIHGWKSLFEAAGVSYRSGPTFYGKGSAKTISNDSGHEVPLSAYSVEELRKVIHHSIEILGTEGFRGIKSFRAAGWVAPPQVLQALASEGIKIDSSALPVDLKTENRLDPGLRALVTRQWRKTTVTSQPYFISTAVGAIAEFPNNGGMADYAGESDIFNMFMANYKEMKAGGGNSLQYHFGFHQETAANYLPRVAGALDRISTFLNQQQSAFRVVTLAESFAKSPNLPRHPLPLATGKEKLAAFCRNIIELVSGTK